MECHICELLSSCASFIHAMRMLGSHGLGPTQVHEVVRMTTLASMLQYMHHRLSWASQASMTERGCPAPPQGRVPPE